MPPKSRRRFTKKPKTRNPPATEEWYTIRRILDERTANGRVEYLVDWDDNPNTGQAYEPTWSDAVTDLAKKEWEDKKALPSNLEQPPSVSSPKESDISQPPRPANWRSIVRQTAVNGKRRRSFSSSASSSSSFERGSKSRRLGPTASPSVEPLTSCISSSSVTSPVESTDLSFATPLGNNLRETSVVVEIPLNKDFDRDDFLSIAGTQTTGNSSQTLSGLETEDSRVFILSSSQKNASNSRHSLNTVPDSQEVSNPYQFDCQGSENSTSPSHFAYQQQKRQSSLTSQVIPDSLESVEATISQSPLVAGKLSKAQNISTTGCHNLPNQALEDLIQDSSHLADSDIPSHQPEQLKELVVEDHLSSGSVSHTPPASQQNTAVRPLPEPAISENTISENPRFLTQPPIGSHLKDIQSSLTSLVEESPCTGVGAATAHSYTPQPLDLVESQEAQPVHRDLAWMEIVLSSSEPQRNTSPSHTGDGRPANLAKELEPNFTPSATLTGLGNPSSVVSSTAEVPQQGVVESTIHTDKEKRAVSSIGSTMETAVSDEPGQKRKLSLEEELAEIFRIDEPAPTEDTSKLGQPDESEPALSTSTPGDVQSSATRNENAFDKPNEGTIHQLNLRDGAMSPDAIAHVPTQEDGTKSVETPEEKPADSSAVTRRRSIEEELSDIFNSALIEHGLAPLTPLVNATELPHHPQMETVSLAEVIHQTEPDYSGVSLADISQPSAPEYRNMPLMPAISLQEISPSKQNESSINITHAGNTRSEQESHESGYSQSQELAAVEYIITLPFQASLRPLYDDTIVEFREPIQEYSRIFSNEEYLEPEGALIKKIDELLNRLFNICDYPQNVIGTALEELTSVDLTKYCCDANPKFLFIYEFLKGLQTNDGVLVIAHSRDLLRLLCHLAESLRVSFSCEAIGKQIISSFGAGPRVTFALPTEEVEPSEHGIIIGFDNSFNDSHAARLLAKSPRIKDMLVLLLVTTHSIEHIGLHVPDDLSVTERKNVMLSGIVRARKLVTDPERGCLEPHEIATLFLDYVNGQVEEVLWERVPLPEEVLDIYVNSQSRSQMPMEFPTDQEMGRKRKLDDVGDSDAKRLRVFSTKDLAPNADMPPLPDEVISLLEAGATTEPSSRPEVLINVPLSVLSILAEKFSEFERRIDDASCEVEYQGVISGLEKRTKEYERTAQKVYESQRSALQDRSLFESEKRKIEVAMGEAAEQAARGAEKAQKRISELENAVARLTTSPDASDPQDTPLAKTEKLLQEALAKVGVLEKRLENSHNDVEYTRNLYQDASATAATLKSENNQLKKQNEDLSKTASANFARIHEVQEQSAVKVYLGQIGELKSQVRDREVELDRARDELRLLKNGRRETRQVSVPRSPRMGMMSPRNGARSYGGSASRGTSPAPGPGIDALQFFPQQQGNGRWNHLRD